MLTFFRMWTSDLRMGRTATEIQARESEKMYMLGPLIERQMSELLDPLIDRVFGIVARAGLIPPPPEEVQGRNVRPEYTSVLANVQKQTSHSGMEIIMSTVGALAQLQGGAGRSPDVLDKLDCDEFIDQLADMYALPAGLVLGDDVVAQNREARKQQEAQQAEQMQMAQEAQAMAAAAPQLSRAARDAGETPLGGGSVLDALTGGGGVG
jgi:Bacteriophage head to tail connecting protein.